MPTISYTPARDPGDRGPDGVGSGAGGCGPGGGDNAGGGSASHGPGGDGGGGGIRNPTFRVPFGKGIMFSYRRRTYAAALLKGE